MIANALDQFQTLSKDCKLPKLQNQIICAYGYTGSGKSTLINYMLQNTMKYGKEKGRFIIQKVNQNQLGPKIGNSYNAETRYPSAYLWKNNQQLLDLPGNQDTRGIAVEILNAWLIKQSLKKGIKMKLMLVMSIQELRQGIGNKLFENVKKIQKLLGDDFLNLSNSLSIVITKVSGEDQKKDVMQMLGELLQKNAHLLSNNGNKLISSTIKQEKAFIFRHPNHAQFTSQLQKLKNQIKNLPVYTLKHNTTSSISPAATSQLLNIMKLLIKQYNKELQTFSQKIKAWTNQNMTLGQVSQVQEKKNKLNTIKNNLLNNLQINFSMINDTLNLHYSKQNIQKIFLKSESKIKLCHSFTQKQQFYDKQILIDTLNSSINKLNSRKQQIQQDIKKQQVRLQLQRKRKQEQQRQKRKLQQDRKRRQREQQERQQRIQRERQQQQRAYEAQMRRKAQQQRQLQRKIAEQKQRIRIQEEQAARKKKLSTQQTIVRQTARIGKQAQKLVKKLFKW